MQGSTIRPFPCCENAAGKSRQKWYTGKQQQGQNLPNLGAALKWGPVVLGFKVVRLSLFSGYASAGKSIWQMALESGDYPIWGTCLGFELIATLSNKQNGEDGNECFTLGWMCYAYAFCVGSILDIFHLSLSWNISFIFGFPINDWMSEIVFSFMFPGPVLRNRD